MPCPRLAIVIILIGWRTMNILLLDSEPVTRATLREALEREGYLVTIAGDLGEAVDRVTEMRPHLLIVRPYINSMPGRMAAEYLRTRRHGLPVLIVGGFIDDGRIQVKNEIDDFYSFPKPFTREDLIAKVKDVLETVRKKP
jgi:DNA-binding response OmpR family regulator